MKVVVPPFDLRYPANVSKGLIRTAGCAAVLLGMAARPAHAAPQVVISPPHALDTSSRTYPIVGNLLGVASDGAGWLVLYGAQSNYAHEGYLMARRIGSDGAPLGAPLLIGEDAALSAQVAFDGVSYVIAWSEYEAGAHFVRVGADGALGEVAVLDAQATSVALAGGDDSTLAVLCDSAACWTTVITAESDVFPGEAVPGVLPPMTVGFSDGQYLAAFGDGTLTLAQFGADGLLVEGTLKPAGSSKAEHTPSIIAAPGGFALAWASEPLVRMSHVAFDGTRVGLGSQRIADANLVHSLALRTYGDEHVLWALVHNLTYPCPCPPRSILVELDATFTPVSFTDDGIPPGAAEAVPSATSSFGVSGRYEDYFVIPDRYEGYLRGGLVHFDQTITVDPQQSVSEQFPWVQAIQAAPAENGWLAVWTEGIRNEAGEIIDRVQATRLDENGRQTAPSFRLDDGTVRIVSVRGMARGHGGWLCSVFELIGGFQSRLAFLPENSTTLQPIAGSTLTDDGGVTAIAASPQGWLVLRTQGAEWNLIATRLDAEARVLDETTLATSASSFGVTTLDGQYVTWWQETATATATDSGIVFTKQLPFTGPIPGDEPAELWTTGHPARAAITANAWFIAGRSEYTTSELGYIQALAPAPPYPNELVALAGGIVASFSNSDIENALVMHAPSPRDELTALDLMWPAVGESWLPRFSEAVGNRVLMTNQYRFRAQNAGTGAFARVLEIVGDAPGGVGGTGGEATGGAAAETGGVGTEEPSTGGAGPSSGGDEPSPNPKPGDSGATGVEAGGMAAGDDHRDEAATDGDCSACSLSTPGNRGMTPLLVLVGLALVRRFVSSSRCRRSCCSKIR